MTNSDSSSRTCSVEGCDNKYYGLGYCRKHHKRFKRHGSPHTLKGLPNKPKGVTLSELLWSRIDYMEDAFSCWEWIGARNPKGYGKLVWEGKNLLAHRAMYQVTYGEIPPGLIVRHSCDNPPCCRPDHLLRGTHADNSRDSVQRGRDNPPTQIPDEWVIRIRERYANGESRGQLAKAYAISESGVYQLVSGKRRANLPGAVPEIAAQRVGQWKERTRFGKKERQQ